MPRILTYIRWQDASYCDAAEEPEPHTELSDLAEVGFLITEDDKAVQIGIETSNDGTHPGRWRVVIPKVNIVERIDVPFDKVFGKKKVRKPRKARKESPLPWAAPAGAVEAK